MPLRMNLKPLALLSIIACGLPVPSAQAGPLIDWLFGHHRQPAPAYAVGYPYAVSMPVVAGYAPVVSSYAASMPVLPSYTTGYTPSVGYSALRPVVSAVAPAAVIPAPTAPTTPITLVPDYRTTVSRTPVTYYRPLLTTDATTGSQVVAMAPCSSYEYQTQRVPTLGLTQLYNGGATLPATTALSPVVSPTVVLPRGGVALSGPAIGTQPYATAYGTYSPPVTSMMAPAAPTVSAIAPAVPSYATGTTPYSAGYPAYASNAANYSALQPSMGAAPATTYPTAPYGGCTGNIGTSYYGGSAGSTGNPGTAYYGSGSTGGGSAGTYVPPSQPMTTVPGAAPYSQAPYGTTPGVPSTMPPAQSYPGSVPVLPPTSSDPAASQQPVLPLQGTGAQLNSKPQLQSVVQQPIPGARSTASASSPAPARDAKPNEKLGPGLLPIPVPDDFKHEPRWNPGLLNEQDQTAANSAGQQPVTLAAAEQDASVAWGSKTIRWASFKEPVDAQHLHESAGFSQSSGLELNAPQSRLRDANTGSGAIKSAPNAIVQPQARGAGEEHRQVPQVVVPGHVKMVPLEEALRSTSAAPSASSPAGDHVMLSPSNGELSIEAARPTVTGPTVTGPSLAPAAAPANRGRYSTDGWQRVR